MSAHKKSKSKSKSFMLILAAILGVGSFSTLMYVLSRGHAIPLLDPKGFIADEQYRLLIVSTGIMILFAALVLFFIYFFAWRYRETRQTHTPNPNAGRSKLLLAVAWLAPISIFFLLSSIMLPATQKLEPQKAIDSDKEQLTIRVIAMRWKWVFLYPEQDIATVNFVQIPVDTPVRFELTADEAPMNGFWIPHLGGMLYAMTEHVNPLNLIAHTEGDYEGGASEINGHGFAGMRFTARVSSADEFKAWAAQAQQAPELGANEYQDLLKPSEYHPVGTYYSPTNKELFDTMLEKYAGSHSHYQINTEKEEQHE